MALAGLALRTVLQHGEKTLSGDYNRNTMGHGGGKQVHVMMRKLEENIHELVKSRRTAQAACGADTQERAAIIQCSRRTAPRA